jgi:hypothetical protein
MLALFLAYLAHPKGMETGSSLGEPFSKSLKFVPYDAVEAAELACCRTPPPDRDVYEVQIELGFEGGGTL